MNVQQIESISGCLGEALTSKTVRSPQRTVIRNNDPTPQADALPQLSQAALKLHQIDQTLSYQEKLVSKMKSQLLELRRTLPPFKQEDAERVRILKSYFGLRQLIDSLTIPPPVKPEWLKDGVDLPDLTEKSTDQEIDRAVLVLDKTIETTKQKRVSLGTMEV